jgi:hypothetical protein
MTSVTTDRRFGVSGNLAFKAPVRVATTTNITLSGLQTIDGVTVIDDDRVLIKNQTDASENGIYVASTGAWQRAVDANGNRDFVKGTAVLVTDGSTQAGQFWQITADNPITIGTTAITWGLSLTASASTLSFIAAGAGAVSRTLQDKERDWVHIRDFGGSTAATAATNTTALLNAMAAVGSGGGVLIGPGGVWEFTAGTNFAATRVALYGIGLPTLDFSAGSGAGFKLDGISSYVQEMVMKDFIIKGGPAITDALHIRRIVRSKFENIRVKEATDNGFALRHSVLNTFVSCAISDDVEAQTTRPTNYWLLEDDGTVGNHTQANVFVNCEASGQGAGSTKTGWSLENAILNVWDGGTAESCNIGVDIRDDVCRMNSWYGFDMEDNQTYDARLKGFSNNFYSSFAQSAGGSVVDNISISTGFNCAFTGGYYRKVNCGASSGDTTFIGVTFDDNASNGIQGTGSFKRYNCITNTGGVGGAKTGTLRDILGPRAAVTLTSAQGITPTSTITKNEATVYGVMVNVHGQLNYTSSGTAANSIVVDIESTYAAKATVSGLPVGNFLYTVAATSVRYSGSAFLNGASELLFAASSSTGNFGISPAVTIANGDVLQFSVTYPME